MNLKQTLTKFMLACTAVALISSCSDDDNMGGDMQGPDLMVYGLTANNELVAFNANRPSSFESTTAIQGLGSGEKLMSIDFRPATGELYALSNASKLYRIHTTSAQAQVVGSASFAPAIEGTFASIDFNPTVDRVRLVSNTGQNLRLHPETGALAAEDMDINHSSAVSISGVAYTNSVAGASATTLYDIDATSGKLFKQDPPNDGKLVEVGSLGMSVSGQVAFDISPDNKAALIAAHSQNEHALYMVNLESGHADKIGRIAAPLIDLAIPTDPVAYAVDASNNLHIMNPMKDGSVSKAIAGMADGETVLGIDFRPATGQLYALGSSSRLYTINLSSGAATRIGTIPMFPVLAGTSFGFDFNPAVDLIRVVSNTGQNLRVNPTTGLVVGIDGILNPGSPSVSAAAYTNNVAGTSSTTLLVLDHATSMLYTQVPPNDGTLAPVGALGITLTASNGFDIGSKSGHAYLIGTVGSSTKLYQVNTTTGAATAMRDIAVGVTGFSVGLGF
ncbi:DUF4394 domain-containing protein [Sphingobacterium griseoflavum]|uniref:DUF4394 domain-containing protein n=1 Tax=Sphingobacterium griseoflavum TaxID=1474952 RepID=A0ABQ3HSJ2_9SPHI|nr:DUF4394 domain-containing protein [Sphingobacterium griseoflavum]GHE30203.1 hypothetical protein GCM10017764_11390 [Sphingobacterium griseoflavum]